jgi:5-methylcytosine-specific restriction protein A
MSPTRPPTPCTFRGCPALVPGGGRCPQHQREERRHYDAQRPTSSKRGYGRNWQRLRLLILHEEPLCRECGAAATDVDHIDGDVTNLRRENLQALCHAHHSRLTARYDGGFGHRVGGSKAGTLSQ